MTIGNPYFGKKDTNAYKEASETPIEDHIKRMTELHHSDYSPRLNTKNKRRKNRI